MTYDWMGESQKSGERPKLADGEHNVRCTQVAFDNQRTGQPFMTRAGDPQIVLELCDSQGRAVSVFCTCSDRAGWVLASLMAAAGKDMKALAQRGVTPVDFAEDREMAKRELLDMRLRVRLQWEQPEDPDGKPRAKVTAIRARPQMEEASRSGPAPARPVESPVEASDDIPF